MNGGQSDEIPQLIYIDEYRLCANQESSRHDGDVWWVLPITTAVSASRWRRITKSGRGEARASSSRNAPGLMKTTRSHIPACCQCPTTDISHRLRMRWTGSMLTVQSCSCSSFIQAGRMWSCSLRYGVLTRGWRGSFRGIGISF